MSRTSLLAGGTSTRIAALVWLVALVFASACEKARDRTVNPPSDPVPSRPVVDEERLAAAGDFVRLDRGSLVRATADAQAPAIAALETGGNFRVVERREDWYRIELPGSAPAWIRLDDADAASRTLRIAVRTGPRPAVRASETVLAAARRQGLSSTVRCGPYPMLTDVDDPVLVTACTRLASSLDAEFDRRYGVRPVGAPAETILLFGRRGAFAAFAETLGHGARGYGAHARGAEGYVALYAEDRSRDELVETLVHELTHLVARRSFGALPRWLGEGLADGLGDSAGEAGLEPLVGFAGAEAEAERLLGAYATRRVKPLSVLFAQPSEAFDAGVVSYDYEQSAFTVRLLLTDPELASRFRAYLSRLAAGATYDAEALRQTLGVSWSDLDARLEDYVAGDSGRRQRR